MDKLSIVSIPQAVWIACNESLEEENEELREFQYRKRYGLHAMATIFIASRLVAVSIPQAVWIACNLESAVLSFASASVSIPQAVWIACNEFGEISDLPAPGFNTASGMDCMQYCLPEALETVSPEVGFLILTPFSRFSPKCAELFCREKCFERGLKPVIARALLSTKEI